MNSHTLLIYLLKSIFISALFMGYYRIALRNKSFHSYNRFYLLLSMACSLVLPLFNFSWFTIEKKELPISNETFGYISTTISTTGTAAFSWGSVILYLSIGISLFLVAFFALNIVKVYQLKRRSAIMKMDGIDFIYTNLDNAPFSFLNNLFWKECISIDDEYGQKIFKHELTHIHQKHTLDILFCQLINSVFWMNPFNWLIQKELKAIHEFIADKEAVGHNNVEEFVKLLLQAHYGKHFLNPTHAFYYSSIKRRLLMLTSKSNTTFSALRKLLVLPVTLLVVVAMSVSTIESKANAIIAPLVRPTIAPQQPALPSSTQQPKVSIPATAQQPKKRIIKNDTTPAPVTVVGYGSKTKKDSVSKIEGDVTSLQAEKIIIRQSANSDNTKKASAPPPIYYIDNKLATADDVSKLKPDQIKVISVWKGNDAIKKYGYAGAYGVVEIITKQVQ